MKRRIDVMLDGIQDGDRRLQVHAVLLDWELYSSEVISGWLRWERLGYFPASTIRDWRRANGYGRPKVEKPKCACQQLEDGIRCAMEALTKLGDAVNSGT